MILKRSNPLNHDQFCRFFIFDPHIPHISLSFLFRHSHDLSIFRIVSDGSQAYRRKRVGAIFACFNATDNSTTDNLFVEKERTRENGTWRMGLLLRPPVEERASLRYSTSYRDLTRPWDESVLRREYVLFLLSSRVFRSSPFFSSNGGQEQLLPEPSNLCPKTKNSFGCFKHTHILAEVFVLSG